ncbi:aldehyde dehydrogenase family protein [Streptomyces endophyticus]|uniref:Aldehyde dehydrogenase family protein n=1 Tax=Streptomyces endophyticus TaxID=714166 RepID=A0ABU6F5T1_9ACTN|nr:aldehyde dehydrogenase family protein [Streptomyces endophyticus]MEB8339344.1 aldehyde dehydrogenase family protein [Streptomyces endophyticus]
METLQNFIGGWWEEPAGEDVAAVVNPATEEAIARFRAGSAAAVDRAVAAAGAAQRAWAARTVARRVEHLHAWADTIAAHAAELAELECREMGKPVGGMGATGAHAAYDAATRPAAVHIADTAPAGAL